MVGIVLGENELGPKLLYDPVREVIVLKKIQLLPHLAFVEVAIERSQPLLYLWGLLYYLSLEACSLLCFHEVDDFLGADFSVVDEEGVFHGVLINELEDFDTLDVILFVD